MMIVKFADIEKTVREYFDQGGVNWVAPWYNGGGFGVGLSRMIIPMDGVHKFGESTNSRLYFIEHTAMLFKFHQGYRMDKIPKLKMVQKYCSAGQRMKMVNHNDNVKA